MHAMIFFFLNSVHSYLKPEFCYHLQVSFMTMILNPSHNITKRSDRLEMSLWTEVRPYLHWECAVKKRWCMSSVALLQRTHRTHSGGTCRSQKRSLSRVGSLFFYKDPCMEKCSWMEPENQTTSCQGTCCCAWS